MKAQNTSEKCLAELAESLLHGLSKLSADSLRTLSKGLLKCLIAVDNELERRRGGY